VPTHQQKEVPRVADQKITVAAAFAEHIREVFGETGRDWLVRLPRLVDELAREWNLGVGEPFDLSYNYVVPARRSDGTEAVLKVSCQERAGWPRSERTPPSRPETRRTPRPGRAHSARRDGPRPAAGSRGRRGWRAAGGALAADATGAGT
jgi:hypothetical protein